MCEERNLKRLSSLQDLTLDHVLALAKKAASKSTSNAAALLVKMIDDGDEPPRTDDDAQPSGDGSDALEPQHVCAEAPCGGRSSSTSVDSSGPAYRALKELGINEPKRSEILTRLPRLSADIIKECQKRAQGTSDHRWRGVMIHILEHEGPMMIEEKAKREEDRERSEQADREERDVRVRRRRSLESEYIRRFDDPAVHDSIAASTERVEKEHGYAGTEELARRALVRHGALKEFYDNAYTCLKQLDLRAKLGLAAEEFEMTLAKRDQDEMRPDRTEDEGGDVD